MEQELTSKNRSYIVKYILFPYNHKNAKTQNVLLRKVRFLALWSVQTELYQELDQYSVTPVMHGITMIVNNFPCPT